MTGRCKALLVGVHQFSGDPENLLPLQGPPHDVQALRAALSSSETGLFAECDITFVLDPTKAETERAMHDFFSAGQRDDILLFYFSGHGRLTRDGKLFLCASDSVTARIQITGIAAATLRDCIEMSAARTFVAILDCCHSGAFRGSPIPLDGLGGSGTFFLASSRARQLADDGDGHGPSPFTAAIVEALRDPASDGDGDGWITFDDVYRVAYARLAPLRQFPQRSTGEGTVVLAHRPASAGASRAAPPAGGGRLAVEPAGEPGPPPARHGDAPHQPPAARFDDGAVIPGLVRDMHARLLAGYAADAAIHAAALADHALHVLAGRPPHAGVEIAELLDDLRRRGTTQWLADVSWLDRCRRAAAGFAGQIRAEFDNDGRRACQIALRLAVVAGLISEPEATACQGSAAWQATESASSALLRLDRAMHRKAVDDMLELPSRVVVCVVHGELDQGHDHFGELMTWRLRSGLINRWRDAVVDWPPPSASLGTRLVMLFEELAHALGVALAPPADDPTTPEGARAWLPALAPIHIALDARPERLLVRHVLRWLGTGTGGDAALVEAYLRAIWTRVALRPGPRIVVSLDLRRIERAGLPLSRTWRLSRAELAAARSIARMLDRLDMPHGAVCMTLPELTSIPRSDLVAWLRLDGGRHRDAAAAEASQLVAATRGGRFDLIVQRLIALNLDHPRRIP